MKTLLSLLFIGQFCLAQIESGYYSSKYIENYVLKGDVYELVSNSSDWLNCGFFFDPYGQYFEVVCEDDIDDVRKFWYEYEGKERWNGTECDVYFTECNKKLMIDYDKQEINIMYDLNRDNYYINRTVWSKISKDED